MSQPSTFTNIRIGTSGWNYPSGAGTWNGIFYPSSKKCGSRKFQNKGSKIDELSYYSEHFDTVEVNSTFYQPLRVEIARRWTQRTPRNFEFSVKLYQKFTHQNTFAHTENTRNQKAGKSDVDNFRKGLEPMACLGKLGAILAQFPASFKSESCSRDYLTWLLTEFRDYPVAVELRHRSWSDDLDGTLSLLNEFDATWTQIDEPKFNFSIRQNYLPNIKSFYYMRLHGRNSEKWWKHNTAEERYNYLYSRDELRPISETIDSSRRVVKKLYLYLNNHFSAKAVANAVSLKQQLGLPVEGEYPPQFLVYYPELKGIISTSTQSLFSENKET